MSVNENPSAFLCGHSRDGNVKRVRRGTGIACLTCFRAHNRSYVNARRAAARKAST